MPSLVKELVPFGLMTCCAEEMSSDLSTVLSQLEALAWWTSVMVMLTMLVSLARFVRCSIFGFHQPFYMCTCYTACVSGSIRLVDGTVPWEGRVEVCKDESWGTVCDDFWSTEDATVACRWAGFSPISMFIIKLVIL